MTAGSTDGFAEAFIRACKLDIEVMKPGNVSLLSPGHGMTAAQFVASAAAAAPVLFAVGAPIGRRILDAVAATSSVAGCNTNLGILLLCAPIASALEEIDAASSPGNLRLALRRRLEALTVADARDAFRAIALASPGGLGTADDQDVHREPTMSLRAAMTLASDRDLIARQYANGHADLFDIGVATWQSAHAGDEHALHHAMQRTFLAFLSRFPDSHIVRKQGLDEAQAVSGEADYWLMRVTSDPDAAQPGLAQWDGRLKARGINPGTSADLAVATAFVCEVLVSRS